MNITSLPDGALHSVSGFLSFIETALFHTAVSGTSSDEFRRAIHQNNVQLIEELDFAEISQDLAYKLTDKDLNNILILIDAGHNLKKLKLTNCIMMSGRGLQPLQGSTVLQHLDLSITRNQGAITEEPMIRVEAVTPIIDSILERRDNVGLLNLTFPKKWEEEKNATFVALKERYGQFFIRGLTHC